MSTSSRCAAAGDFFFAPQGGPHHGGGAAYPAVNADRPFRAVEPAGAALHTGLGPDQLRFAARGGENPMRADGTAQLAAGA